MSRVSLDQLFLPKDGLMECLKTVGAKPGPLNFQQVMDFMKEYIMKRQLFDHSCPSRILCGQDPLGKVFGVEQFLVNDVIGLLVKQMYAVPRQHVVSQVQAIKRQQTQQAACSDVATATETTKRARLEPGSTEGATNGTSPMRLYIPSSPVYSSGAETEYSVQGRETDWVKDTSDDLWFLEESSDEGTWSDDTAERREVLQAAAVAAEFLRREAGGEDDDSDCPFEVEYEIEESDQEGFKTNMVSSDSDIEEVGVAEIVLCVDDDAQFWADSSDSYSSDSEIGEPDLPRPPASVPCHRESGLPRKREPEPLRAFKSRGQCGCLRETRGLLNCSDLWQCRLCGNRCEMRGLSAVQRYCAACWQKRFGWLPDRTERHPPQKKRRRVRAGKRSSSGKSVASLQVTTIEVQQISSAAKEEEEQEEGSRPASRSDESAKSVASKSSEEGTSQGSEGSLSSGPNSATTAASSQEESASQEVDWSRPSCSTTASASDSASASPSASAATEMCTICLVRPKCAVLVHGRLGHRLTCYKCAKTLERNNLPCPVCRRRIQHIVRIFDA